ncbi:MAG: ribosome maturation factor RimM [Cyclobacteriaceae bacterium]|nr:ribosome maturation factor RimM [Cyclobacteriaceae bacterium]
MNFESCYQLGYVLKTHGLKGELVLVIDADDPQEYSEMESVFVEINKKLVPFFIDRIQLNGSKAIIKFEEIDSIENAKELKGSRIFLPLDVLPELKDGYYFHELIGFKVIDSKEGELGLISGVFDSGSQDLIAMQYQEKEVLIPLTDEVVTKVDKPAKTIYTTLPDGLLDIYLLDDAD